MRKLLLIPFLALALFACDKDDDENTEPEEQTPTTTYNTELIFTSDTSIKQVFYTDSEGNFKAELMIDPELRKWSKKLNFAIGDTIEFGGSAMTQSNSAEIDVMYTGSGKMDTISDNSAFGSAYFEAAIIP